MRLVTIAGGVASAVVSTITAFLVSSLVAAGIAPGRAGLMLASGSAVGIAMRVVVGWAADRSDRVGFLGVAAMLAIGTVGFLMLSFQPPPILLVGTLLAFGAGWGWPGLFHLAVAEHNRAAPAAATGTAMVGLSVGAALGPGLFGLLADGVSFSFAWRATACLALMAALIAFRTDVVIRRDPSQA
jgi:cyanate permease